MLSRCGIKSSTNSRLLYITDRTLTSNSTKLIKGLNVSNLPNSINFSNLIINQNRNLSISTLKFGDQVKLGAHTTVGCPPFADSISEGDVKIERNIGDFVNEDEAVIEVETDKTAIPVPAPHAGKIIKWLVEDGDTVEAGQELFILEAAEAGGSTTTVEVPKVEEKKVEAPKVEAKIEEPVKIGMGTPPPIPTQPLKSTSQSDFKAPIAWPIATHAASIGLDSGDRTESRVKMDRMRKRMAQRLKDSQNTAALLTTFNEIDMSNIIAFRNKYKDQFLKQHGIKLGFMSAFAKASAYALEQEPLVNASIDDVTGEIVYRNFVDISIAVATPKGLVVPVVRDVHKMNYFQVEKSINDLGVKAREGKLSIEDSDGGTFTISNGGVFGSLMGTPIINPPQSAILGMHGTFDRPVAIKGQVEIRPMMYIALTYDHRLINGRDAVTFLKRIKNAVEDPMILQLSM